MHSIVVPALVASEDLTMSLQQLLMKWTTVTILSVSILTNFVNEAQGKLCYSPLRLDLRPAGTIRVDALFSYLIQGACTIK